MANVTPLSWFKFTTGHYMSGRIQKRSKDAKVAFMEVVCKYWDNRGELSVEDAKLDFGEAEVTELIQFRVIKEVHGMIRIKFLDEQLVAIQETSAKNSLAGQLSAKKRRDKMNDRSTTVQRNPTDKTRQEEIRRDSDTPARGSLVEIFFEDLPNSSMMDWVIKTCNPKRTKEELIKLLQTFKSSSRSDYKNFNDFAEHFRNWVNQKGNEKRGAAEITKGDKSYFKKQ